MSTLYQTPNHFQVFRPMRLQPFQQASAEMGGGSQFWELLQDFKIGLVAVTISLFKHMVEVTQRLVVVDAEEKF